MPPGPIGFQGKSLSVRQSGASRSQAWGTWSGRMWIAPLLPATVSPKAGCLSPASFTLANDPVGQAEHRGDRIAGYEAEPLGPGGGIGLRDQLAGKRDRGLTPLRLAAEVGHQVEHMAAEHPEIFASAAVILLAAGPDLEHLADPARFDQVAGHQVGGGMAVDEGEAELCLGLGAGGDHRIGLGGRSHEGLLHEDAPGAGLGRGDRHLGVAVEVSGADGHDVGLHGGEHLAPVAEARFGGEGMPLGGGGQPGRIVVGRGHHLGDLQILPELVDCVAPVAPARSPDHRHPHHITLHASLSRKAVSPGPQSIGYKGEPWDTIIITGPADIPPAWPQDSSIARWRSGWG